MDTVGESVINTAAAHGSALKESIAIVLVFFALQFAILALGPGDPGAGVPAAWNSLLANTVAAFGVVLSGWLVSRVRFFTGGMGGIGVVNLPARDILGCLLAGALLGFAVSVLSNFFEITRTPHPLQGQVYLEGSTPILIAWIASLVLVAPIGEEMVCRGFILPALARKIGVFPAIIGAALLFLLPHLLQVGGYWVAAVGIFSLGILAGVARVRTGSVFAAMLVHAAYNAIPLAYMLWDHFLA